MAMFVAFPVSALGALLSKSVNDHGFWVASRSGGRCSEFDRGGGLLGGFVGIPSIGWSDRNVERLQCRRSEGLGDASLEFCFMLMVLVVKQGGSMLPLRKGGW